MAKTICISVFGAFLMTTFVHSISIPILNPKTFLESNKTITDDTMRKLLGSLKMYLEPVQAVPDEGYLYNTSSSYVNAKINGTHVSDLTDYTIDVAHADMSQLEFEMGLTFAAVNATGIYNVSVDNSLFHLLGNGKFKMIVVKTAVHGRSPFFHDCCETPSMLLHMNPAALGGQVPTQEVIVGMEGCSRASCGRRNGRPTSVLNHVIVNITQFKLSANLTLMLTSNKTLEMKDVSSDFNFHSARVNFENLGEDADVSSFLNDFINEFIVDSMTTLKPNVQELIKERLMTLGNFLVTGMTVDNLVDLINSLV